MRLVLSTVALSVAVVAVAATSAAQGTPIVATGALLGRVTLDSTNVGVSGAVITIVGTSYSARSDSMGRFFLQPVPSGPQIVRVQQIGFVERRQSVIIAATGVTAFDFRLIRPVTKLDTQRVLADNWLHKPMRLANTTKYDDFYARKVISAGGIQLTHEELEKRVNANLAEVFSSIPAVHMARRGSRYMISLPNCPEARMAVFVNGHKEYPLGPVQAPNFMMPAYFCDLSTGGRWISWLSLTSTRSRLSKFTKARAVCRPRRAETPAPHSTSGRDNTPTQSAMAFPAL